MVTDGRTLSLSDLVVDKKSKALRDAVAVTSPRARHATPALVSPAKAVQPYPFLPANQPLTMNRRLLVPGRTGWNGDADGVPQRPPLDRLPGLGRPLKDYRPLKLWQGATGVAAASASVSDWHGETTRRGPAVLVRPQPVRAAPDFDKDARFSQHISQDGVQNGSPELRIIVGRKVFKRDVHLASGSL
jgi:hypothetical protein